MSEHIVTLFGEVIKPEPVAPLPKPRSKKKQDESKTEELVETAMPEVDAATKDTVAEEKKEFDLPEEWEGDKKYYSIGEVSDLFKVKTSHIRFWTNEFKLKVRTTRKGDRLYTPEQIREIKAIYHLVKERGFTISGAKAKLKAENKRDVETIDLNQSLTELRNKLIAIRNQLV